MSNSVRRGKGALLWLLSVEEVKEGRMEGWESALAVCPLTVKYLPWEIATRSPRKRVFLTNILHASHFTHFCMKSNFRMIKCALACMRLEYSFNTANIHVEEGQSCPMAEWQNSTIIRSGRGEICAPWEWEIIMIVALPACLPDSATRSLFYKGQMKF